MTLGLKKKRCEAGGRNKESRVMRGSFDLLSKAHTDLAGNQARAPHSVCVVCTADHPDVKCEM